MNAIVFAAGVGKRMGALTKDCPKCLLPVGGETMLSRWFDALLALGVEHIYFNAHHLANKVRRYVADRYSGEVMDGRIVELHEPILLGSMGTINKNRYSLRNGGTILAYCDVWTEFDIGPMVALHMMGGADLTLGTFEADEPKRCGILQTKGTDVIGFVEKPKRPKGRTAWSGIAVASERLMGPAWGGTDIGSDWIPRIIENGSYTVRAYPITQPIIDIGTKEGYKKAQEAANESFR